MITTLKELEQLDNKYKFVGITSLPPLLKNDAWIGFAVIAYWNLTPDKTEWQGFRLAPNIYDYLVAKRKYKLLELPEAQYE